MWSESVLGEIRANELLDYFFISNLQHQLTVLHFNSQLRKKYFFKGYPYSLKNIQMHWYSSMSSFCCWIGHSHDESTECLSNDRLGRDRWSQSHSNQKMSLYFPVRPVYQCGVLDRRKWKNGQDLPMTKIRRRTTVLLALIDLTMQIA